MILCSLSLFLTFTYSDTFSVMDFLRREWYIPHKIRSFSRIFMLYCLIITWTKPNKLNIPATVYSTLCMFSSISIEISPRMVPTTIWGAPNTLDLWINEFWCCMTREICDYSPLTSLMECIYSFILRFFAKATLI